MKIKEQAKEDKRFFHFHVPPNFDAFSYIYLDISTIDLDEKFKTLCLEAELDYDYVIERLKKKAGKRYRYGNIYHDEFGLYIQETFYSEKLQRVEINLGDEWHIYITLLGSCINHLLDNYLYYDFIIPVNHKITAKSTFVIKFDSEKTKIKIPFEDIIASGLENYAKTSFETKVNKN